ncbi:hypothetical protein HNY73_015308 [Argiope bruennichi]|uniref:Uncharacterized protein n=1 Tax=Argiope bruennichi TaxID=94029 RepID=A0A8T0ETM1_ARGBR|nr:hypothetical protein HNY73_015308 [Argiope bruennichi]
MLSTMDIKTDCCTKSLLKKSNSFDISKAKKVTFSNTVKVFVDDPSKLINTDKNENLDVNYIEISIVDKSKELLPTESFDDCKVTDFLVHKVIYDNYVLPDDDELCLSNEINDENPILFESGPEDDELEFVVHKVTDHEDDLIKKDADFSIDSTEENENISVSDSEDNKLDAKFSKLSVENILEHDKIIALIDQTSLGLSALSSPSLTLSGPEVISDKIFIKNSDKSVAVIPKVMDNTLVLSPPLQELSLDKIVKAHSENVLCDIDISPLNSIQETDSDSDVSSEGTMIMMTSEECQKNEQHIRESFLKFQSLKERTNKTEQPETASDNLDCSASVEEINSNAIQDDTKLLDESVESDAVLISDNVESSSAHFTENFTSTNFDFSEKCSSDSDPNELPISKRTYSSSLPDTDLIYANYHSLHSKHAYALKRASSENGTSFIRKPAMSVEIPSDVREWKILLSSVEKITGDYQTTGNMKENENSSFLSIPDQSDLHEAASQIPKSDELENFVHESTERVERIRKRYYVNGKSHIRFGVPKHVRGIRPRFGSTAEILQLMQKRNNPPFVAFNGAKNHMSWPCEESNSSHEPVVLNRHSNNFYVSQSSSQSSIDSYSEEPLNTSCDHYSISSCPSIIVHERGSPEGASPPRPRTEINVHSSSQNYDSDSFVYYSLKI